jgi:YfiH family protein
MSGFLIEDRTPWPLGRFPVLAAMDGIVHAVTTRAGPDFGTVGTSARTATAAHEAARAVGLRGVAWVHQVHGGTVLVADEPGLAGDADALVTDVPGLAVLGRGADCPLVLMAGRRPDGTPAVGFAHASWRATVRGLTARTLARLRDDLGVDPATVTATIAPSAGPCCYEVGDEVREEALARLGPAAAVFFAPRGDRWHLDLWAASAAQLAAGGVAPVRVVASGVCTICRGERFFSWRRQGADAGRFAALVGVIARPAIETPSD